MNTANNLTTATLEMMDAWFEMTATEQQNTLQDRDLLLGFTADFTSDALRLLNLEEGTNFTADAMADWFADRDCGNGLEKFLDL